MKNSIIGKKLKSFGMKAKPQQALSTPVDFNTSHVARVLSPHTNLS